MNKKLSYYRLGIFYWEVIWHGNWWIMNYDSPTAVADCATVQNTSGSQTTGRPTRIDRHRVCIGVRHCVENAASGNGLRLGHDVLATFAGLVESERVDPAAPSAAGQATRRRQTRFFPHHC